MICTWGWVTCHLMPGTSLWWPASNLQVAPSSSWYRASLSLAPLSAPTHQTWQAPSWDSWRKTVGLLLWAPPSVSRNVHTAFSLLPATDGSDIFLVFSFVFFWPPPHLFQADVAGGQQSGEKQHRPAGPYATAVDLDFRVTCEVHSKYSNSILFEFLNARTVLGRHSESILTAFVQHSRHLPTRHQALFGQQSNCTHMAFEVHSEHYVTAFWIFLLSSNY